MAEEDSSAPLGMTAIGARSDSVSAPDSVNAPDGISAYVRVARRFIAANRAEAGSGV